MRVWSGVLIAAVGCGRLAFDATSHDAAPSDVPADAASLADQLVAALRARPTSRSGACLRSTS
jgi:hypothetical protein